MFCVCSGLEDVRLRVLDNFGRVYVCKGNYDKVILV